MIEFTTITWTRLPTFYVMQSFVALFLRPVPRTQKRVVPLKFYRCGLQQTAWGGGPVLNGKQLDELGGSFELPKVPLHMGMFLHQIRTLESLGMRLVFPCV